MRRRLYPRGLAREEIEKYTFFVMYKHRASSKSTMPRRGQSAVPYLSSIALGFTLAFALSSCAPDVPRSAGLEAAASMPASEPIEPAGPGIVGYLPLIPLDGPIKIGLQPGHWRIEELPEELARRLGARIGVGVGACPAGAGRIPTARLRRPPSGPGPEARDAALIPPDLARVVWLKGARGVPDHGCRLEARR